MSSSVTSLRPATSPAAIGVLLGLLAVCVGGGALIGIAFAGDTANYTAFSLPSWAPPSWVFGPVWTVLYALMAVSAWLVWRSNAPNRTRALTAFGVQLLLNFAWTPVFFGLGAPVPGLLVIIGVLTAVAWWLREAWAARTIAGALQLPYLGWVSFATALNAAIALG